ncbi:FAD binding domain-containing protein [Histoplasma capsulatum]|uniref:FAD binding domain-containing protein n=1 Tax=Ajellomyces capsulatus TaxID=5037 RepID=A0A8A1LXM3_AJECA|nr:predicted protein [Histoplasma mississippiense (nom. inval.)]EDN03018.1 predicted protein [Histoplasma mississippiense (nom. inval.)]QSS58639.1 FAD binding domain-containing protein [Histoplasma capsulatum]
MIHTFSLAAVFAYYASSSLAISTCEKISSISNIEIKEKFTIPYAQDQKEYWSADCGRLKPSCILEPESPEELSLIVRTLGENNETFAIKSGGHNPNRGFSSVDGGPLISLKGFNEITYDESSGLVRVGAGHRWTDVVKGLEPKGVTAVGGRIGHVGVGGYTLGGGLSYLSTQTGWTMNTVVEFDVVLANGDIVKASNCQNTDLFNVLRGGGNAFGIVTTYTLKTHKIGKVWGGNLIISAEKSNKVLAAVRDFTEYYPDDKAAIIATRNIGIENPLDIWLIFLFYDGETAPPGTFDNFTNIGPILNTAKTQSYSALVSAQDALVITGNIVDMAVEHSPLPNVANPEVMQSINNHFEAVTNANALVPGLLGTLSLQPIPKRLARHARENGGDLLDLDDSVDRLLVEFNYAYTLPSYVPQIERALKAVTDAVRKDTLERIKEGTLPDAHLPLFMNDANHAQDYFGRLRPEKLEYARRVRSEYDPKGLFRDRTGGFKM